MSANSSLNLSSLDFDTLKNNFKSFMKSQSVYKDYNFDGANFNVLLDILAYNTYLNSFYQNMVASEMFLDSAQKLDSVVSHAKELNYVPRSARSAKAAVSFSINTTGVTNPLVIPKGTIFGGQNSNGSYQFVTAENHSYLSSNSTYVIANLAIYEGSYVQDAYIVDYAQETQRFVISNENIDTQSLLVTVSENNGQNVFTYTAAEVLWNLSGSSTVFFLQGSMGGRYEITFGDGVFGRKPQDGAVIIATYRVSNGTEGNGISVFNLDQDIAKYNGGVGSVSLIQTLSASISGANAEGIESIRFNAPRHYQTQGRCVTRNDYISTIIQQFPEVQDVNVYGGEIEDNIVQFGTVFISPSTYSGTVLTESRKADIETYVNDLSPVGIQTKVVDPDYMLVELTSTIHVDFSSTTATPAVIIALAHTAAHNFNISILQRFNTAFRLSRFQSALNIADDGILSNETTTRIYKVFSPVLNLGYTISCNYSNPIIRGSVVSSQFVSGGKSYVLTDSIDGVDAGSGVIYQLEKDPNVASLNYTRIGNVDYVNGIVNVNQISYFDIGGGLKIFAKPVNQDIYCYKNTILEIDTVSGLNFTTVSE